MTSQTTTPQWAKQCPVFYETLAAAAQCKPEDAYEHYHSTVRANVRGMNHPVEAFLEDYAVAGAK